jgi:hypothetical protein
VLARPKKVDRSILECESAELFRAAIKSKFTRDGYERRLVHFLNWYGSDCGSFVKSAKEDPHTTELKIIKFILEKKALVEKRQYAGSTVAGFLKAIRLLLEMNDAALNWKKIRRTLPPQRRFAEDRICTIEELRTILKNADHRIRALTLVLLTSGVREGAIEYMKVRHIQPIAMNGEVVAAKLKVYAGEPEEYISFVTRECWDAVKEYLKFREEHEDHVNPDSPLFRDKFDSVKSSHYRHYSSVERDEPKPMTPFTINKDYNRVFYSLGFRKEPKKRHEFSVHGFRKWFKTTTERAGMKPIDVETLMGHSTGVSDSYYRPTETDLLNSYLAIAPSLSISESAELKVKLVQQEVDFKKSLAALEHKLNSAIASIAAPPPTPKQV